MVSLGHPSRITILTALLTLAITTMGVAVPAAITEAAVLPDAKSPDLAEGPDVDVSCQKNWCQDDVSICLYWGGVTAWDVSLGPVPGMTLTTFDEPCGAKDTATVSGPAAPAAVHDEVKAHVQAVDEEHNKDNKSNPYSSAVDDDHPVSDSDPDEKPRVGVATTIFITEALDADEPEATQLPDCALKYCKSETEYCHYWAGITGWDASMRPVPGMTHVALGPCAPYITGSVE